MKIIQFIKRHLYRLYVLSVILRKNFNNLKILITGGCGYKGSVLIPLLLKDGHEILNIDTQWFGNELDQNPKLENINLEKVKNKP